MVFYNHKNVDMLERKCMIDICTSILLHMNTKQLSRLAISLFLCITIVTYIFYHPDCSYVTVWGDKVAIEDDEIAKELIETDVMKRIKGVDQSGPASFFGPRIPKFTRYEHCLSVYALLRRFKVSRSEQIAGLLHDASHTAFSHVCDFIFVDIDELNKYAENGYQDEIHVKFLNNPQIIRIIAKHGWSINDIDPENSEFKCLDTDLPRMCADRIQYNIHTGVICGLITKKDAKMIVDNLRYENGEWFFIDAGVAKKFGRLSLHFTRYFWGSKWNISQNIHMAMAIKNAMKVSKKINTNDMTVASLYKTDEYVMNKLILLQSAPEVGLCLQQCKQPCQKIQGCKYESRMYYPKFRGINPFVLCNNMLIPLTEIDKEYKDEYKKVENWCKGGYSIDVLRFD